MTSTAFADLRSRLDEVKLLSTTDPLRADASGDTQLSNAVCKGCLVLLSAHLEGYVEDLATVALDEMVRHSLPVERVPLILRALHVEHHLVALEPMRDRNARAPRIETLFARESQLWNTGRTLDNSMLDARVVCAEMTNPGSGEIASFFKLFGIDLKDALIRRGADDLLGRINGLIARRNEIAHGELQAKATPNDVDTYLQLTEQLATLMDEVMSEGLQAACSLATRPW
jgi:hypothetical protein